MEVPCATLVTRGALVGLMVGEALGTDTSFHESNVDESGCLARHQDGAHDTALRRVVHAHCGSGQDSLHDDTDHARAAPHG